MPAAAFPLASYTQAEAECTRLTDLVARHCLLAYTFCAIPTAAETLTSDVWIILPEALGTGVTVAAVVASWVFAVQTNRAVVPVPIVSESSFLSLPDAAVFAPLA